MADGMFNSSGGGGGGGNYYDYSNNGRSNDPLPPEVLFPFIGFIVVVMAGIWLYNSNQLAEERELDRTVYVETSRTNFDSWQEGRTDEIVETSLWFEDGSSHRERGNGGDYHCKGGQFQTTQGATVTFCCSVVVGENPACLVIDG